MDLVHEETDESEKYFGPEVKHLRLLLSCVGLWPYDDRFGDLKFLICFILYVLYTIPSIVKTGYMESDVSLNHAHHISVEVVPLLYIITKVLVFKTKSSNVKVIVEQMYKDGEESKKLLKRVKQPMLAYGKKARLTNNVCRGFFYISAVGYLAEPFIRLWINSQSSARTLPNKGVYPFATDASPNYELVYFFQTGLIVMCVLAIVSIDGFFTLAAFHGCAQFKMLSMRISQFVGKTKHLERLGENSGGSNQADCSCLKCIVDRHVLLSTYVEIIDDVFHAIIMARLIINTVHFCGVGYIIVKSKEDSNFGNVLINVLYMITMASNLFLFCWIGEHLMKEADNVGQMVYELDWYNQDPKKIRSLILIILRSRKSSRITAGKYFIVSFAWYKEWFLKAVGFLSVLLAIKSQN